MLSLNRTDSVQIGANMLTNKIPSIEGYLSERDWEEIRIKVEDDNYKEDRKNNELRFKRMSK